MMKRFFVATAILLAVAFVAPPASAAPPTAKEIAAATALFNHIDGLAGVDLARDAYIDLITYRHSKSMAKSGVLSHRGYKRRFRLINENDTNVTALCENVAYVSGTAFADPQRAAKRIFNGWRNSAGHNQCMNRNDANTAGVGIEKRGATWWATFIAADDSTL